MKINALIATFWTDAIGLAKDISIIGFFLNTLADPIPSNSVLLLVQNILEDTYIGFDFWGKLFRP